ncbi:SDR family NAD(P)-dependent oxidoreductase [Flavobacterium sp. FlaQc-47]|uniref:SDR family NAD(P)-dependent oxidoreductase n=1 Tax=Flavobacterium sp. FlaQc-47 TaxID=3374180 RepID=UPI003757FCF3
MENTTNKLSNPSTNRRLEGKVALITGGNSGIGLATAKRFVAEGAHVFITGRREKELNEAVALIGHNVTAIVGDVSKLGDLDHIYAVIKSTFRHIDIVFANAGVGTLEPLGSITEEGFNYAFDVNVRGTLFTVQKALPLLTKGSSIILTGSTTGSEGNPAFSVYGATKAAVRNLARSWAVDLKGSGIRVNVLSPGATSTPGLLNVLESSGFKEEALKQFEDLSPLGRVGDPSEIAAVALFLASDDSSYMTGGEIFVDGGSAQI